MNPQNGNGNGDGIAPIRREALYIVIVAIVLVIAVVLIRNRGSNQDKASEANALNPNQVLVSQAAAAAVEIQTATVKLEDPQRSLQANGVIHFSPYSTINVSPRLTGKVIAVLVKVGDRVSKGQPLAEMQSPDAANAVDTERDAEQQLQLTQSALSTAQRQFKLGTPEINAAEANLIQAQENMSFTKRELALTREQNGIGGFTDKPLTDAQSAVKQAQTQLAQDQKDERLFQNQYDREVKLLGYGVAAKNEVEVAENALNKQHDAVENDREQVRIAQLTVEREQKAFNTKLYANQTVRQAEMNYQQAVTQQAAAFTAVRMAKAALLHDLKQAEHDAEAARADLHAAQTVLSTYDDPTPNGELIVHAPADGVITARNVNPGQLVDQTGETPWQMFTIVNAGTVYVDSQIYEKDMLGIRVGESVSVTSDALPAKAQGVLSYVSPGLDPTTHTLSVRADIENRQGLLKDGMFVRVSIAQSPRAGRPVVPLASVVRDGDNDYVFVASGGGKYDRRQVTLGEQRGEGDVLIEKGLTGNETIVTHGALFLGSGGTEE